MAEFVRLDVSKLKKIRDVNSRLVSYNIEFAEVTGGTFWKSYTPGQIAGTEPFSVNITGEGITAMMKDLMQIYPPINLYNEKIRKLAKELGPVWVRVSGTWATKTYYDFDGTTNGKVPDGYLNVLTKEQWIGVLDFVKAVDAKLLVSVSNCPGLHSAEQPWHPAEAEKLFSLSKFHGVPIAAAEFANEPNILEESGFPKGYTAAHYRRDQDLFFKWLKENYPETLCVGPCTTGGDINIGKGGGVEVLSKECVTCAELMDGTTVPLDVFSYHYYNGLSERLATVVPDAHWQPEEATGEAYLDTAMKFCRTYLPLRDKYVPGAEMWVTESGDAGGGGDTWASTYMEVLRTLNELGGFSTLTNGVIFHNTLASSDYGYLKHGTYDPRPSYFAVLLWNRLMGPTVYDTAEPVREGVHTYAHSRKDGKDGYVYLVINNSMTDVTTVELPKAADIYALTGNGNMRSSVMYLNGTPLILDEDEELPKLTGKSVSAGTFEVAPGGCTFFVL